MRETDLFGFQRQLDRVDDSRVDGNFLDAEGRPADLHAQRVSTSRRKRSQILTLQTLLYLLRRSYAYIYSLLIASEPVSEALLPIYNQLQTMRRCLIEVRRNGGVSSPRELYPYSMKVRASGRHQCFLFSHLDHSTSFLLAFYPFFRASSTNTFPTS